MQRQNTFRELRNFLSGIRGDQYVISREQESKDPLGPQMWWLGRESSFSLILYIGLHRIIPYTIFQLCLDGSFGLTSTKYGLMCLLK